MTGNNNESFMEFNPEVQSPCINKCSLDQKKICTGCFRSSDEITSWSGFTRLDKKLILKKCLARRLQPEIPSA